ncbi:dephospho-CoA kinase [Myroides indicus]|uniref:Dephospho-CoA kinase n=1 Tax=Myroides indicus TaxID=1323422 RepID=A0A4R7F1J7_9FLAO|nr:dephospho-CoA kinase [Myroides indicus]TDS64166.1 dephospho-CoA kinase [Myroides indicus]
MTKIVGLTGGIGSGKTMVANFFKEEGIPVYISDERAKIIMDKPEVIQKIQEIFDENVQKEGKLNRKRIREIVFKESHLLEKLNAIVHPAVKKDFKQWVDLHQKYSFVIKESALLFEQKLYKTCDYIILVTAPEEIRVKRVVKRDGVTAESIRDIIRNQLKDEDKIPFCDWVIINVDKELVKKEIKNIIEDINLRNNSI